MSHRIVWIILGVLCILGGVLALANPLAASLTAVTLAGWMFLFIGLLQTFAAFRAERWSGRIWALLVGISFVILGIMVLGKPLAGMISLTLVVAVMFLVTGIFKIVLSFGLKGTQGFWLVLLSGALSVILALMIFSNFPVSAATVLGVLLAVELISSGVSMIALSGTVEKAA